MGKQKRHMQGARGEAFLALVRGVPQERILAVGGRHPNSPKQRRNLPRQ